MQRKQWRLVSLGIGSAAYMEKMRNVLQHVTIKNYKANLQHQKTLTYSLFVREVHSAILAKNKCLNHLFFEVT
jgi:hypothetical protein